MGIAVIGGGIRGLVSAYVLAKSGFDDVVVYEKEEELGGHAKTVTFDAIDLDLGFFFLDPVSFFFDRSSSHHSIARVIIMNSFFPSIHFFTLSYQV